MQPFTQFQQQKTCRFLAVEKADTNRKRLAFHKFSYMLQLYCRNFLQQILT